MHEIRGARPEGSFAVAKACCICVSSPAISLSDDNSTGVRGIIYPTYRKPFDLIFVQGQNEAWRGQRDDLRTLLGDFVAAMPQVEITAGR